MAKLVLKDAYVDINAVPLSDHVRTVTVNYSGDMQETTGMGATGKEKLSGLTDWSVELEFQQDYAAAEVDVTLHPLVGAAAVAIKVRPTSAAVAATNPELQGNVLLETYGQGGTVGDVSIATATFQGTGALTRAVA